MRSFLLGTMMLAAGAIGGIGGQLLYNRLENIQQQLDLLHQQRHYQQQFNQETVERYNELVRQLNRGTEA